jgi:hypothetical protein
MKTKIIITTVCSLVSLVLAVEPAGPRKPAIREGEQRLQETYSAYGGVDADYAHAGEAAVERWMDWKWGLRIHWGLYSMFNLKSAPTVAGISPKGLFSKQNGALCQRAKNRPFWTVIGAVRKALFLF